MNIAKQKWVTKTLDEICLPGNGLQTGPFGSQLHASEYTLEGVPVVMPKDMINQRISTATIARIPEKRANDLDRHRLKKGDIIFGRRGDIGRCALVTAKEEGWLCGSGSLRVRLSDEAVPNYLIYYLGQSETIYWLESNAVGQTMLNLSAGILASLPIELPPLPEQHKIAEILSTWDEAIDLTEQLIAAKQKRKQALMQQLLTGKERFPRYIESQKRQETPYGDLPSDWRYSPISAIAEQCSMANLDAKQLPVLSCTKHEGLVDSLEYFGRKMFSDDLSSYKVVTKHQFAYATNHIEEGSIGYQDRHDAALISPMYTVFEADKKSVVDSFLYRVLKTEQYRQIFALNTNGSVNRRGSLRWKEFSKIHVPLPSIVEQQHIAMVLDTCDQELTLLQQKLEALRLQKKGLMQQLLTGKIRVKV